MFGSAVSGWVIVLVGHRTLNNFALAGNAAAKASTTTNKIELPLRSPWILHCLCAHRQRVCEITLFGGTSYEGRRAILQVLCFWPNKDD